MGPSRVVNVSFPATDDLFQVVVVGYSQSSQFVHAILQTNPTLFQAGGGVMLLAGAFHPVDTLIEYQLDVHLDILQRAGYTEAEALESMSGLVEAVNGLKQVDSSGDEQRTGSECQCRLLERLVCLS